MKNIYNSLFTLVFTIFFISCGSDSIMSGSGANSKELDSRLVGRYYNQDDTRETLEIKEDGSFIHNTPTVGFDGGTQVKGGVAKGKFSFSEIKKTPVKGFEDEYSQFITGVEYVSNTSEGALFNHVNWGPEYSTKIGFLRREATGIAPQKSILFVTEYNSQLFIKQ